MATRRQPARRTRKSRLDSGATASKGQTKKRKIRSERPILSGSASSSGQKMVFHHKWTTEEEHFLFSEAQRLLTMPNSHYSTKKMLNEALARSLNTQFADVKVKFTCDIVKSKILEFQSKWASGCLTTQCGKAIDCSPIVANFFFGATPSGSEAATSFAADSVNLNNGGNMYNGGNVDNGGNVVVDNASIVRVVESMQLTKIQKLDATDLLTNAPESQKETFMGFTDKKLRLMWIKRRIGALPLEAEEDEDADADEVADADA